MGDVGSNLVHRKRLQSDGIQFTARRIDKESEFLTSTDIWFRPVQMANGPSGGLYVIDMYREVIEHPKSLPPVIKKHLDLNSGRDRGRIYRIVARGRKTPNPKSVGNANTTELVALLDHDNGWHRETASRILCEQGDREALPLARKLASTARRPEGKIRALHTLRNVGGDAYPVVDTLIKAMKDEHPEVRRHAVQLSESLGTEEDEIRATVYELVRKEMSSTVRYQLAFSLGQWQGDLRDAALAKILRHDGQNRWIQLAALSSLNHGAGKVLTILVHDEPFADSKAGQQIVSRLATQIGKQQRPEDIAAVAGVLAKLSEEKSGIKIMPVIIQSLAADQGSELGKVIAAATKGKATEVMNRVVQRARKQAAQDSLDVSSRLHAIHLLSLAPLDKNLSLFEKLLEPDQPVDVQLAALATLGDFDDSQVALLLIRKWTRFSPQVRRRAADVILSKPGWLLPVTNAVRDNRLPATELGRDRLAALASYPDQQVRQLADSLLKHVPLGIRSEVLQAYQEALKIDGTTERGRTVFQKNCATCHRLENKGHAIGPNLAAMRNRGMESILVNVLDPNREVNPQYISYSVITTKGKSLTGMVAAESATSITLQRAENATDTVLRIDIDEMRGTGKSLMPEGLEKEISVQAMADLLNYLESIR